MHCRSPSQQEMMCHTSALHFQTPQSSEKWVAPLKIAASIFKNIFIACYCICCLILSFHRAQNSESSCWLSWSMQSWPATAQIDLLSLRYIQTVNNSTFYVNVCVKHLLCIPASRPVSLWYDLVSPHAWSSDQDNLLSKNEQLNKNVNKLQLKLYCH